MTGSNLGSLHGQGSAASLLRCTFERNQDHVRVTGGAEVTLPVDRSASNPEQVTLMVDGRISKAIAWGCTLDCSIENNVRVEACVCILASEQREPFEGCRVVAAKSWQQGHRQGLHL